jgi:DNA-binding transcriptional ArsR family regulator
MLRIHFTARDLGLVRIAAAPDPLWELSLSMHVLRLRTTVPWMSQWKHGLVRHLEPHSTLRHEITPPLALNPPLGYFPDFLTPTEGLQGLDPGLEAVMATPRRRLRHELETFAAAHPRLVHRIPPHISDLVRAMRRYHDVALAPIWDRIRAAFDAERALRARALSDGGVAALLNSLAPGTAYRDGVVEISNYIASRDLYLDGRGLLLVPSYFKRPEKPMVLADPALTPVLIYSVSADVRAVTERRFHGLAALIGRTRAAVLELVADGGTTTGMASRLGISAAAVSQHLSVLREGGLVVSVRSGNLVHHGLTALGRTLLAPATAMAAS